MILFLIIAFIGYFLSIKAETSNLLIIKFIFKSKIYLVIIIAIINYFNILTIRKYFFFLIVFFGLTVFAFNIIIFSKKI